MTHGGPAATSSAGSASRSTIDARVARPGGSSWRQTPTGWPAWSLQRFDPDRAGPQGVEPGAGIGQDRRTCVGRGPVRSQVVVRVGDGFAARLDGRPAGAQLDVDERPGRITEHVVAGARDGHRQQPGQGCAPRVSNSSRRRLIDVLRQAAGPRRHCALRDVELVADVADAPIVQADVPDDARVAEHQDVRLSGRLEADDRLFSGAFDRLIPVLGDERLDVGADRVRWPSSRPRLRATPRWRPGGRAPAGTRGPTRDRCRRSRRRGRAPAVRSRAGRRPPGQGRLLGLAVAVRISPRARRRPRRSPRSASPYASPSARGVPETVTSGSRGTGGSSSSPYHHGVVGRLPRGLLILRSGLDRPFAGRSRPALVFSPDHAARAPSALPVARQLPGGLTFVELLPGQADTVRIAGTPTTRARTRSVSVWCSART